MLVDTHVHLDDPAYADDLDDVVARAATAGVRRFVIPGVSPAGFAAARARAPVGARVCVGLHPMALGPAPGADDDALAALAAAAESSCALGEIGLDRLVASRGGADFRRQQRVFAAALDIARVHGRTAVLHVVRAHPETRLALDAHLPAGRFVVHRFEGSREDAEGYLARGGVLGLGPALTFPRASRLRELVATLPLDQLVLETDGPFVPGMPRGEPSLVRAVCEVVASAHGVSAAEVARRTTATAVALFGLGADVGSHASHDARPATSR